MLGPKTKQPAGLGQKSEDAMPRKRFEGTQLTSWEEVDKALAEIGAIDRDLALSEASQNESIDVIKAEVKVANAPRIARKEALELSIKEYCEVNRAEFAKVKTKQLTFGSVGFRLSSKVLIKRVADTLQALKDLDLKACIRTKEEIDKDALKNLSEETLASVGAAIRTENVFGYEINRERIVEAA